MQPVIKEKEIEEQSEERQKKIIGHQEEEPKGVTKGQSKLSKRITELFEGKEENVEKTESKPNFEEEMAAVLKEEIIEKVEGEIVTELQEEKEESELAEGETEEINLEDYHEWVIGENNQAAEIENLRNYIAEAIKAYGVVVITGEVRRK